MQRKTSFVLWALTVGIPALAPAAETTTTLDDSTIEFRIPERRYVRMTRGDLSVIVVDNEAVDLPDLPQHRAGYNGIASLKHAAHPQNLFVPGIAGLNFEHIHDGTTAGLVQKFEPRHFPMQLRIIDRFTVDIYQPPTGNFQLESCGRYRLLENGMIEYTFECIPHADRFHNDFIGLFWASYIQQPEDKSIWFYGRPAGSDQAAQLINAVTRRHGVDSTHRPQETHGLPEIDADFPLTLVNHPSRYEYTQPWYYGISHGMAFVQMFRNQDNVWMAQSPSGGGNGNPAWDFQWFIKDPVVGQKYGFVMRAACVPFEDLDQLQTLVTRFSPDAPPSDE